MGLKVPTSQAWIDAKCFGLVPGTRQEFSPMLLNLTWIIRQLPTSGAIMESTCVYTFAQAEYQKLCSPNGLVFLAEGYGGSPGKEMDCI